MSSRGRGFARDPVKLEEGGAQMGRDFNGGNPAPAGLGSDADSDSDPDAEEGRWLGRVRVRVRCVRGWLGSGDLGLGTPAPAGTNGKRACHRVGGGGEVVDADGVTVGPIA